MKMTIIMSALGGCLALTATGCGETSVGTSGAEKSGEGTTSYPVAMQNCGVGVTVEAPPQRVVTLTQPAAEVLIDLGLGDRVIGTGYEIDKPTAEYAEEYARIPQLAAQGEHVTKEKMLEAQPDFVYSTLGSFFVPEDVGSRRSLHDLEVPTYASEFDCALHAGTDNPNYDMVFQEYRDLAEIFDVPEAGEDAVAEQTSVLDEAVAAAEEADIDGETSVMFLYSAFEGTPWVAAGGSLPQDATDRLGVKNAFGDSTESFINTSWDEVAARDPDVIVIADLDRGRPNDPAEEKLELLRSDPLTRELTAVENGRLITMPGANMEVGPNSVQMIADLVDGLLQTR